MLMLLLVATVLLLPRQRVGSAATSSNAPTSSRGEAGFIIVNFCGAAGFEVKKYNRLF